MTARFGAVDLGSNSVRCLGVAGDGGTLKYLFSGRWATRLSEGMTDEKRDIVPRALERTMEALEEVKERLQQGDIPSSRIRFFATESLRSAEAIESVIPAMEQIIGVPLHVLGGREEARYSLEGALLGIDKADAVFDLGGGSLEVAGHGFAESFRLGAVRMASLYGEEIERISVRSREVLQVLPRNVRILAGVGGTSSSAAMMMRKIPWQEYHPAKVHRCRIERSCLGVLLEKLKKLDVNRRRQVTGLEPSRADIIVPGLRVILALLDRLDLDGYTHSETDLLWAQCAVAAAEEGRVVERAEF
jgi:exopolyphosphatase/guanosine-5'-triphosphate,3'-diphosphate pyrophosphatase